MKESNCTLFGVEEDVAAVDGDRPAFVDRADVGRADGGDGNKGVVAAAGTESDGVLPAADDDDARIPMGAQVLASAAAADAVASVDGAAAAAAAEGSSELCADRTPNSWNTRSGIGYDEPARGVVVAAVAVVADQRAIEAAAPDSKTHLPPTVAGVVVEGNKRVVMKEVDHYKDLKSCPGDGTAGAVPVPDLDPCRVKVFFFLFFFWVDSFVTLC